MFRRRDFSRKRNEKDPFIVCRAIAMLSVSWVAPNKEALHRATPLMEKVNESVSEHKSHVCNDLIYGCMTTTL